MNKGAKAIISLALGVILMLGIYHIYRPQINSMADNTFGKVQRMVNNTSSSDNYNNDNHHQPNKNLKHLPDNIWKQGTALYVCDNEGEGFDTPSSKPLYSLQDLRKSIQQLKKAHPDDYPNPMSPNYFIVTGGLGNSLYVSTNGSRSLEKYNNMISDNKSMGMKMYYANDLINS